MAGLTISAQSAFKHKVQVRWIANLLQQSERKHCVVKTDQYMHSSNTQGSQESTSLKLFLLVMTRHIGKWSISSIMKQWNQRDALLIQFIKN
jgi:hypothetical protein